VGIYNFIGRRPIAAFGNSDGDLQMLQWTATGGRPRFMLLVHHDDADREYAYDRDSPVGRLDKALDEARQRGWVVVSMKHDWKVIYPFELAAKPNDIKESDEFSASIGSASSTEVCHALVEAV
jgi:hypothetical protein